MSDVEEAGRRVGDVVIRHTPGVIEATLDRPQVINCLNDGLVAGLEHAIALTEATDSILLVLRGAGGNFCAGADLKYVGTLIGDPENSLFPYIDRLRNVCDALANGSFISLAIVEGYALAGGFEILTSCDLAVATTTAAIGDRHLEYGLAPGLGASVRIAHHLSTKQARYLAFTGEMICGAQAAAWGLVSHAWDNGVFEQKTAALVSRLASRSPAAVRSYKRMLLTGERANFDDALLFEQNAYREYHRASSDARHGIERFTDDEDGRASSKAIT